MTTQDSTAPRSIDDYLAQLRLALHGADAAVVQDALSDAEEHLRAECAARPGDSEETVLDAIAGSYGSPADVAAAYRETERTVQAALAPQRRPAVGAGAKAGFLQRFFGIYRDPRAWTALFFMLLALVTGIFYFTVVVTGLTLSLGLAILIIGVPFFIAFLGFTRVLSFMEGRIIEAMTGERMPRRVQPVETGGWLERIVSMLRDPRTWTTLVYQLLMLPLGTLYFTVAITVGALGVGMLGGSAIVALEAVGIDIPGGLLVDGEVITPTGVEAALYALFSLALGVVLITALLHIARLVGHLHGKLAKQLLVAR
jgi:uncharacterized membrane protein